MFGHRSPAVELEPLKEPGPVERSLDRLNLFRHHHQRAEQVMQFVLIAYIGPALFPQFGNRGWIKPARFAQQLIRNHTPHGHRTRPPLFQRRIVEKGIRVRVQQLMRKGRRNRAVDCKTVNRSRPDSRQQCNQSLQVHRFRQHILHHFLDQGVIGNLDIAFNVFLARGDLGENAGQQVIRSRPLHLRRNAFAVVHP
jgi:hypothetical protein